MSHRDPDHTPVNPRPPPARPDDLVPESRIWQDARAVQSAASARGFDWEHLNDILDKLVEEACELREAQSKGDRGAIVNELGDVLFVVSHYAWRAGITLEDALAHALAKFQIRFEHLCSELEREGIEMRSESVESLERRWQGIKSRIARDETGDRVAAPASPREPMRAPPSSGSPGR